MIVFSLSLCLTHITLSISLPLTLSLFFQDDAYITYFYCYSVVVLDIPILYTHTNNITNSHTLRLSNRINKYVYIRTGLCAYIIVIRNAAFVSYELDKTSIGIQNIF